MDGARFGGDADEHAYSTGGAPGRSTADDDHGAAMFSDFYASEGLGSLPPHRGDVAPADDPVWGAPPAADDEEPPAPIDEPVVDEDPDADEDTDAVDTAPTRVPTGWSVIR